jgi:hypothetical protein
MVLCSARRRRSLSRQIELADQGGVAFKGSYSSSCNGPTGPLRDSYNATVGEDATVALSNPREGKE